MNGGKGLPVTSGNLSNCLASVLVSHAASAVLLAASSEGVGGGVQRNVASRASGAPWATCSALLSCIISRDVMGARSWSERRRQAPPTQPPGPQPTQNTHQQPGFNLGQPQPAKDISALYNASTVQERMRLQSGALRDRQIRLQSVRTDLLLDLPHPVALPDGEEGCGLKILRGGDEIYRGYIRPPPNRTIWEGSNPTPPPPYHHQQRSASTTSVKSARESNSRPHRASYPQGASGPYAPDLVYSDPPPCYSDVIASPDYHRTTSTAGVRSAQKSEL